MKKRRGKKKKILQMPKASDGFLESPCSGKLQLLAVIESRGAILLESPKVIMLGMEAFRTSFIKKNMAGYQ